MSYCRWGDGSDVYMYPHVGGYIECCSCKLADKVQTIFTKGCNNSFFGAVPKCGKCDGAGCDFCMMHGNMHFDTAGEALAHLLEHRRVGHDVPEFAIERLSGESGIKCKRHPRYQGKRKPKDCSWCWGLYYHHHPEP